MSMGTPFWVMRHDQPCRRAMTNGTSTLSALSRQSLRRLLLIVRAASTSGNLAVFAKRLDGDQVAQLPSVIQKHISSNLPSGSPALTCTGRGIPRLRLMQSAGRALRDL